MDIVDINKYMSELNKALKALNMVDFMAEYNKEVHEQLLMAYDDGFAKGKELAKKELEESNESDSENIAAIRNEAWDCFKKLVLNSADHGGLTMTELEHLFGTGNYEDILVDESLTGDMAVKNIKSLLAKKERENEIEYNLGDIVMVKDDRRSLIVAKHPFDPKARLLQKSKFDYDVLLLDLNCLKMYNVSPKDIKPTGKNLYKMLNSNDGENDSMSKKEITDRITGIIASVYTLRENLSYTRIGAFNLIAEKLNKLSNDIKGISGEKEEK